MLVFPFLFGSIALFIRASAAARSIALGASLVSAGLALMACLSAWLDPHLLQQSQFALNMPWLPSLGINVLLDMDGLSLTLVLLACLLQPLIVLATFRHTYQNPGWMYGLMGIMQGAMIGVFMARDGFLFYTFWELALIPIYFICLLWGGERRERVTFKFFVYTLGGSLLMLLALLYMYLQTPGAHSFAYADLARLSLTSKEQAWLFWAFFAAFAVKMPVWPFHTWQPDTYTEAPSPGTMLLSGVMLKMGIYGVMRWVLPLLPDATAQYGFAAAVLSIIGILYASTIALRQNDMKRLIAFSSIGHVGLIAAGVFTANANALAGASLQMLAHGINVVGLFYVIDVIQQRTGIRTLSDLGGLRKQAPMLATYFMIIMLGSVALPLTNGFAGEFMLLNGIYEYNPWLAAAAGLTVILSAAYMLTMYQRSMLGPVPADALPFSDVRGVDHAVLLPICVLVLVGGLLPNLVLHLAEPSLQALVQPAFSSSPALGLH